MDVKYINPFVLATQTVFKTMLNLETNLDKPRLKTDKTTSGDVTGVMGLVATKRAPYALASSIRAPFSLIRP
ncbi:MAG TPA: hypothetical protein VMT62_15540 [Syntrophorhabdaceae bacterium]|nr:hypothetical protein [Syntrophorhabdaceae bacterium]